VLYGKLDLQTDFILINLFATCLQCFDVVDGQQEGHPACKKLSGGVLALLSIWSRCIFAYCLADAIATHYPLLQ